MSKRPHSVSGAIVAECCGISRRQHSRLVKDGVMPKADKGRLYELRASVLAFVAYRLADGPKSLAEEKLAMMAARRKGLEIQNAISLGELVSVDLMQQEFLSQATHTVGLLQALPSRIASRGAMLDAASLRAVALEEVNEARQAMADRDLARANELATQAERLEKEERNVQ